MTRTVTPKRRADGERQCQQQAFLAVREQGALPGSSSGCGEVAPEAGTLFPPRFYSLDLPLRNTPEQRLQMAGTGPPKIGGIQ